MNLPPATYEVAALPVELEAQYLVPVVGYDPTIPKASDFKSDVNANSTTQAYLAAHTVIETEPATNQSRRFPSVPMHQHGLCAKFGGRLEGRTLKAFTLDCFQDSSRRQLSGWPTINLYLAIRKTTAGALSSSSSVSIGDTPESFVKE